MLIRFANGGPVFYDVAAAADNHRRADRTLDSSTVHHLLAEGSVPFHYLRLRVGQ